jgi:hypothetical protein
LGGINLDIKFRAENGLCPYFIHGNLKFFIQDENIGNGNYRYSCYVRNLDTKVLEFVDEKEAKAYVQERKGVRYAGQCDDRVLFTGILVDYIICKNKVTVRETAKPLTGDFDIYNDCLAAAKEKVTEYIRMIEPEQISMFA